MSITLQKVEIDGHTVQLFQEEDGGHITGYSFSMDKYYSDPMDMLPEDFKPIRVGKTQEEIDEEVAAIREYPTLDLDDRGIRAASLERFHIRTGVSEVDGETITTLHFPYTKASKLSNFKTKLIDPKKFWSVGDTKDCDLFGWEQAIASGSPKLFIVEGELDVPATYQMLKDKSAGTKWDYLEPAVVSVPNGAGAAKTALIKKQADINKHFKDVVLVFDMDEAGQKAAKEVSKIMPSAQLAEIPSKDANKCLIDGKQKAFCNAILFKAQKPKNTRILQGGSLSIAAKKKPKHGLSWPFPGMTHMTKGIRREEVYYIGAGVKQGKSILLSALGSHQMVEHDLPILVAKPEEAVVKTYQEMVAQVASRRFNDPDIKFDEDAYDRADLLIRDKAFIIDAYQFVGWDNLREDIRYAVVGEGVEDIYIDPITCLVNNMTSSEANEFLNGMAAEIASMAKDLHFTSYLFSHLKAPSKGEPHERGGKVQSVQFVNSRGMMRSCHQMWGLEGNRDPELEEDERNKRRLVLLEDREYGASGHVDLFWDKMNGKFNEVHGQ